MFIPKKKSRLRETLAELGVSQRELARRTEIDPVYIGQIINDGIDIRGTTAERIANALGVPIEKVITEFTNEQK